MISNLIFLFRVLKFSRCNLAHFWRTFNSNLAINSLMMAVACIVIRLVSE
jgi:hypothetical protein